LIFNDTEYITIKGEKLFIINLIKKNKNMIPIIFICNNNHSKLLNDIKKLCNEIKFYPPSSLELNKYIKNICKSEKIKIDDNPETINRLIELSQYDIRRLLNLLQDFSTNYNKLNLKNIEKFCNKTIKKNVNYGLYDATFLLLNKKIPINDLYRFYENEKVLLPLMIQENSYKKLTLDNTNKIGNIINDLVNISDSISNGDIIETSIYTDQNWCLQDIHGFYTCVYPSKIVSGYKKEIIKSKIDFSSDLNKTSIKNINKKNINNLQKIIGCKSINEILLLSNLSNYCFENNMMENIVSLLKSYSDNLDIKDIELCLKINKTVDFNTLNTKDKKLISNLL
jgi:DNA polymerase III delta prime subunit